MYSFYFEIWKSKVDRKTEVSFFWGGGGITDKYRLPYSANILDKQNLLHVETKTNRPKYIFPFNLHKFNIYFMTYVSDDIGKYM